MLDGCKDDFVVTAMIELLVEVIDRQDAGEERNHESRPPLRKLAQAFTRIYCTCVFTYVQVVLCI